MKSRLVLARYIEANISELVEHLIKVSKMIEDTVLRNLIQTWLQYNVAILNGKSCPMADWAAQFVERNRSLAIMTGDAYLTLKGFQKALTEQCVGQVKGVTDAEILSIVYDNSSCFEQAVVEYFALSVLSLVFGAPPLAYRPIRAFRIAFPTIALPGRIEGKERETWREKSRRSR